MVWTKKKGVRVAERKREIKGQEDKSMTYTVPDNANKRGLK